MPRTLNLTHAECIMLIRAVRRCAAHDHNEHAKVADALYDCLVELDTRPECHGPACDRRAPTRQMR